MNTKNQILKTIRALQYGKTIPAKVKFHSYLYQGELSFVIQGDLSYMGKFACITSLDGVTFAEFQLSGIYEAEMENGTLIISI